MRVSSRRCISTPWSWCPIFCSTLMLMKRYAQASIAGSPFAATMRSRISRKSFWSGASWIPSCTIGRSVGAGIVHWFGRGMLAGGVFSGPRLAGAQLTDVRFSGQRAEIVDGTLHNAKVAARVVVDGEPVGKLGTARVVRGRVTGAERGEEIKPVEVVSLDGNEKLGTVRGLRVVPDPQKGLRIEGDPRYISHSSELYRALRKSGGEMVSWGIDLSKSALARHDGFADALPYYVLVALVVATGYYQQRQMTVRNPQAAQNPQAQLMGRVFPVIFGYISLNIAAGVVVYFCVSNLWQIAQQALIFRQQAPAGDRASREATAKPARAAQADGQVTRPRQKKGRK
ncbi:MAG: hypothetical protein C4289_07155 [Chloroflexota bacterium]